MTRICWRLVEFLCGALQPDERDAALGDLAESHASGPQALRDVLGLVARRQAHLWTGWRPWLALAGLAIPLGLVLTLVSRRTAYHSAIYLWLYVNNWNPAFIENASFRHDLFSFAGGLVVVYLMLACWSWTAGLALGFVSRGATPAIGVLFILVLTLVQVLGAFPYLWLAPLFHSGRDFGANAAVFEVAFYRVVFPLILQAVLVLLPALWGMRQGLRFPALSTRRRAGLRTAAIATLAAIGLQETVAWRHALTQPLLLNDSLRFFTYWPLAYLLVSLFEHFRSARLKENPA